MDITQKISLYDILAMIVPGLLLMSLGSIITIGLQPLLLLFHKGGVIEFTAFLTMAYIVGLIWNAVMEYVFNGLRNNRNMICLSRSHKLKAKDKMGASLLILKMGICEMFCGWACGKKCRTYSTHEYYRRYYFVMKNKYCDNISILEGHVAFLRNTFLVILFYGVFLMCTANDLFITICTCSCCSTTAPLFLTPRILMCLGFITIAVSLFMLVLIIFKQQKIYKCVFEDFQYLSEL